MTEQTIHRPDEHEKQRREAARYLRLLADNLDRGDVIGVALIALQRQGTVAGYDTEKDIPTSLLSLDTKEPIDIMAMIGQLTHLTDEMLGIFSEEARPQTMPTGPRSVK